MSDTARWQRLSALFDALVDLDAHARATRIEAVRADDPGLALELAGLLAADAAASDLDRGAAWLAPDAFDDATNAVAGETEEDDAAESRLGDWQLGRRLGHGGMGTVHAAERVQPPPEDPRDAQRAAIKRLHRRWDGGPQAQRFLQERRILGALSHPNLPRLIDHGVDADARPWFALELVEGRPLDVDADARRLGLRDRLRLFRQVCAAVQHAHEHFVVHRDLKPSNILVDADGYPKVLDFGVAKRIDALAGETRTGAFAGFTPEYAAPEQVSGGPVSAATDVYALGVILYQLLAGRLPYGIATDDLRAATEAIVHTPASRLDQAITTGTPDDVSTRLARRATDLRGFRRFVRGDLSRIVQTALAKEPSRRYRSVQALSDDVARFLEGRTVSVVGDTFAYRARTFARRNRWGVAMGAAATLALAIGVGGIALQTRTARAEAARANSEAARAEAESARAGQEVRRLKAVNDFMASVFAAASPETNAGAPSDITLAAALDHATEQVEDLVGSDPRLALYVLHAAANSYDAMGAPTKADAVLRRALSIQETALPDASVERGMVLAMLAYVHAWDAPKDARPWIDEAVALHRAAGPQEARSLFQSLSILVIVQYVAGEQAAALATQEEAVRVMRSAGMSPRDEDYMSAISSLALTLAGVERFDEAMAAHEESLRLYAAVDGADGMRVAHERVFFSNTLNRAGRWAPSLAQLERAIPIMRARSGADDQVLHTALLQEGRALVELGRAREALAPLAAAHDYGRTRAFNEQQSLAGHYYARAQAMAGRCAAAGAVVADLRTRRIDATFKDHDPRDGTACAP